MDGCEQRSLTQQGANKNVLNAHVILDSIRILYTAGFLKIVNGE